MTDTDTTFLVMRRGAQKERIIETQLPSSNDYRKLRILHQDLFPSQTDALALPPFLKSCPVFQITISDVGHESKENLLKLDEEGVSYYITYNQFDREARRSHQTFTRNLDNWKQDKKVDSYTRPDGPVYSFSYTKFHKAASGLRQEIRAQQTDHPQLIPQYEHQNGQCPDLRIRLFLTVFNSLC